MIEQKANTIFTEQRVNISRIIKKFGILTLILIVYQNEIGLSADTARLLAALNGTEYFLASWIAVFTIERFGRRQLMLFGAAGQSISMVILAITTHIGDLKGPNQVEVGKAAAAFLFIFNTFFAIGWLGMVSSSRSGIDGQ